MLNKLIRWIGKEFMVGSGYQEDLHSELHKMRKAQEKTIQVLLEINAQLKKKECTCHNKEKH